MISSITNQSIMNSSITNQSMLNSTCECSDLSLTDYSGAYARFNALLIIGGLPALSVFGLLSNIANLYIYTRPSMRNAANTYLASLATSDFFVVLTGLFIFWVDSVRTHVDLFKETPFVVVYVLPFGYFAQMCSIYFTVTAAVDCYFKVLKDYRICMVNFARSYCTVRWARRLIMSVVVASAAYNSLRFGQFRLHECTPSPDNVTEPMTPLTPLTPSTTPSMTTTNTPLQYDSIIEVCPTQLYHDINLVYNVYMYMVLMTFLPFILLAILNALIVAQQLNLKREGTDTQLALSAPTLDVRAAMVRADQSRQAQGADDTITMIMVVIMFLCCNVLALVVNLVESFLQPSTLLLNYLTDASNFLVIMNSSVNFVIYMIFNPEYRRLFIYHCRLVFCCCATLSGHTATNGLADDMQMTSANMSLNNNHSICTYQSIPSKEEAGTTQLLLPVTCDENVHKVNTLTTDIDIDNDNYDIIVMSSGRSRRQPSRARFTTIVTTL